MFSDCVTARYTKRNTTFTDESGDVGCWEEDEGDWEVLDESDVETGFAAELDISTFEEIQGRL
jgi:hypothetical protein